VLRTEVIGCADCLDNEPDMLLTDRLLPERFVPEYSYTYIVPDVEEVKQRSETYSAYLNYMVGRWNLLREYKNNATELKKVEDIIMELKNNPDLTISDFTITGYASPEGSSQSNLLLSQRRAESFAKFLETKYEYDVSQFTIKWAGEDWNGLKEAVAASGLANKNDIIEIINTVSDQDARDGRIIALDNGVTYKRLLNDFYPQLRRNDYNIAFVSRPFNVKEASEIIKTSPNLLSLNEMFHVANTFPADSEEFREVFETAVSTFPESEVANMNVAITELNNNKIDAALRRLEKMKDNPAAWNLLGVCYAQKGMNEQAAEYFKRAIEHGDAVASHNLQQLERYLKDN
jgi:tetratricopeptide (TPR) repeat protein